SCIDPISALNFRFMSDLAVSSTPKSQAASDDHLIDLWVHNRPAETVRTYRADLDRFRAWAGKPLAQVTLADLAGFWDALAKLSPVTRTRMLPPVRSLLAFGHRIGYLPFDVGRPFRLQALPNQLAERILPEAEVQRMLHLESDARNRAILTLL